MKKLSRFNFILGFILGAVIFGGSAALATAISATPSTHRVIVNGSEVHVEAYLINGRNYFQLRDMAAAIDFSVVWDGENDRVLIDTSRGYDPNEELPTSDAVEIPVAEIPTSPYEPLYDAIFAEYVAAIRNEFYRLVNEHRAAHGLRKLEVNLELQRYADIRADEQRILRGHTRTDGSPAGSGWHNSTDSMNTMYAENVIGVGYLSDCPISVAVSIFTRWKNSPAHNAHMLFDFEPETKMAFGIVPRLDENGFVTSGAVFATGF